MSKGQKNRAMLIAPISGARQRYEAYLRGEYMPPAAVENHDIEISEEILNRFAYLMAKSIKAINR